MKTIFQLVSIVAMLLFANSAMAYSAIAVDDEAGESAKDAGYGVGRGDTKAEAKKDALKVCKSYGSKNCKVMVEYNECGAYAASINSWGSGTGKTEAEAKKLALKGCGNKQCRIVASDCE